MWKNYINVATIDEALQILSHHGTKARIIAGGTDILLELERGLRDDVEVLIDISRIQNQDQILLDEKGFIHLGPLVTHNHCVGSKMIREYAYPLARAAWEVGSPQIRNRGTVAGNLITGSPANDTISPLMALGAVLVLRSLREERVVPLKQFYTGVRKTVLQPDEMLVDIIFPMMNTNQKGIFIKHALRRAQAISVINLSMIVEVVNGIVGNSSITLGAVAPTIIHAEEAEEFLAGKSWTEEKIEIVADLVVKSATPITDLRSSAYYRLEMVRAMSLRALKTLFTGVEEYPMPENPIRLGGRSHSPAVINESIEINDQTGICTRINGTTFKFEHAHRKNLLRLIREDALLTGTKEGCAEGECGACTVFLDGVAVMSCLVPAGRAHNAEITTIEGVGSEEHLHPVQAGMIQAGAVQCGYCTPGFVMSGIKLLEENSNPSRDEIKQAITGNLCRCTGYYKIIQGIEMAAKGGS